MNIKDRLLAWFISWVGWAIIQIVGKTSKIHSHYHPSLLNRFFEKKPVIYAFWHRFQLLMLYQHRNKGVHVLVSQSKDGELIAQALHRFGFYTIRGSSSRGGGKAFLGLMDCIDRKKNVAFTPDGPRGPFRSIQPGVLSLAQKMRVPIVPLAWAGTKTKELSSWDRFLIPLPFGRFEVVFGEPLFVDQLGNDTEETVRKAMDRVYEEAKERLKKKK